MKRLVVAAVVASLALAGLPARAEEAKPTPGTPETVRSGDLRASIDRAMARAEAEADRQGLAYRLSEQERGDLTQRASRLQTNPAAGQAGGGGGAGKVILIGLLSTAVSAAGYYYFIKKSKDLQTQAPAAR